MAPERRAWVKLPPSGKITKASFSSRPVTRAAISVSRSMPRPGVMKRAGMRCSSVSMTGSQASVAFSTTRGSREYHAINVWIRVKESPGPACRQHTRIGTPGWASGTEPWLTTSRCSTRRASAKSTAITPCTRS